MTTEVYAYIGSGPIYLRDRAGTGGLVAVGSCSKLAFTVDEETKDLTDYTSPGGGVLASVQRIKGVNISLTMDELTKGNLTRAIYGTSASAVAGSVVDEVVTAKLDALVMLSKVGATAHVVTNSAGTTTYVLDTDYTVEGGGIIPLSTGAITEAQSLKVDFSYPAQDAIQGLAGGASEFELVFDGFNEARTNKRLDIRAYRVKFGPAKALDVLGSDFAKLEFDGKVLKDATQAPGISQYFTVRAVD